MSNKCQVKLLVDNRERKLIELLKDCESGRGNGKGKENQINYEVSNLPVGDIWLQWCMDLNGSPWKTYMVIERKTYADLNSALCSSSNRYREQKFRMKKLDDSIMKCYVFEGNLVSFTNGLPNSVRQRSKHIIHGALFNTQFRDNFQVYQTGDVTETLDLILKLYSKLPKYLGELDLLVKDVDGGKCEDVVNTKEDIIYSEKLKKKTYLNQTTCYINQLTMVSLISHERAVGIVSVFPTMESLVKYLRSNGPESLSELLPTDNQGKLGVGTGKPLGKKASRNLYEILLGELVKDKKSKSKSKDKDRHKKIEKKLSVGKVVSTN